MLGQGTFWWHSHKYDHMKVILIFFLIMILLNLLRVLPPHPVVKLDKLSANPGQHQLHHQPSIMAPMKTSKYLCSPADRPRSIHYTPSHSSCMSTMPRASLRRYTFRVHKKRVVFADEVGRPLTVEHLFTPETCSPPSTPGTKPCPRHLEVQPNPANRIQMYVSDPTEDFDRFVSCPQNQWVKMKSFKTSESLLHGEVYLCHGNSKKTLNIKVFYDPWKSPKNVPCIFLRSMQYYDTEVDLFSFEVRLPQNTERDELIEFCFTNSPEDITKLYECDNKGQSYKVVKKKAAFCEGYKQFYASLSNYRRPVWPRWQNSSLQTVTTWQFRVIC